MNIGIHRCEATIRAGKDDAAAVDRCRALMRSTLAAPLEQAFGSAGIGDDELVCVRRLRLRLAAPARATDGAVVHDWSHAIAAALEVACLHGDAVRYTSQAEAVFDLLVRSARADTTRLWAWQQLGLVHVVGDAGAARESRLGALLSVPQRIVPLLSRLTHDPIAFDSLCASAGVQDWHTLARAALSAAARPDAQQAVQAGTLVHGAASANAALHGSAVHSNDRIDHARPGAVTTAIARSGQPLSDHERASRHLSSARVHRILARSRLAARLFAARAVQPACARALAALILLEVEPAASTTGSLAADIEQLAHALLDRTAGSIEYVGGLEAAVRPAAGRSAAERRSRSHTLTSRSAHAQFREAASPQHSSAKAADAIGLHAGASDEDIAACNAQEQSFGSHAGSEHAGLLYLVNVLAELDVAARLCASAQLEQRSLAGALQWLGCSLSGAAPDDPAIAAFCGVSPNEIASWQEPPMCDDERSLLGTHAIEIATYVHARLAGLRRHPRATLKFVTARSGHIRFEPGWTEVRYRLADVSTEIRRAGLDRDPGYVRWCGAVLKFVYE